MRTFLVIIQTIVGLVLMGVVLAQPSKTNGLSGLVSGGGGDTFYSKNKSRTSEALLSKITVVCSIIFAALCLLQNVIK